MSKLSNKGIISGFKKDMFLYILIAPAVLIYILFSYLPMFGVVIAFQDYLPSRGFFGSKWVGLENFSLFFNSPMAFTVIKNTFLLSIYSLIWGFPFPILFALFLNEIKNSYFKKFVQTVSIFPNFLSNAIVVSMVILLLHPSNGVINIIITKIFHMDSIYFMAKPEWFRTVYIASGIWQSTGWGAIIYLASLAGINPELYEAATIDGANRFRRMWHISIPGLRPTIIVLLILSCASLMGSSVEKVLLMQNPLNYDTSMTLEVYTYRKGLGIYQSSGLGGIPEYSYASAIGLWQSVVNVFLLITANKLSGKFLDKKIF